MKIAISIPDAVFKSAESLARRMGVSRSQLYATAVAEYVARHRRSEITRRLDEVYAKETAQVDPGLRQVQARSLPKDKW
jgi:predicted transcriptional regulator